MKLKLQGITDLSTVDWPGRLAAVVFLQGCNLRCPWCQNVEGVDPRGGREASVNEVLERVQASMPLIDSVVITGGEPLFQPKACVKLLEGAKELGLGCALETNGSYPEALERALPHLDFVALDVKAPFSQPELYARVSGVAGGEELVQAVKRSLGLAAGSRVKVEARTTVVPRLTDRAEVVERLAGEVRGVERLVLQQFKNQRTLDPSFQKLPPLDREAMLELARAAKRKGAKVAVFTSERGIEEI